MVATVGTVGTVGGWLPPGFVHQLLLSGVSLSLLLVLAGAALVIAEAIAPGAHLIVLGVALLITGLVGLLFGTLLDPFTPFVLAAVMIVTGGLALFVYREFDFYGGKGSGQTSDSESLRGQTGRVTRRVTETDGEVKLEGGGFNPYFQARTIDGTVDEGEEVIVVDPGGGNVLTVESLAAIEDDIDRELAKGRSTKPDSESESDPETEPNHETDTA